MTTSSASAFNSTSRGPDDGPYYAGVSRDGIGIMLKAAFFHLRHD